ncbi:hypothetical protein EVAR_9836_1 [Eumeta japonica]|uniref:Uncharacterized protein n=1 Tax=Eumeta variegata TaxID=151549 RepID=A0A4C1TQ84_EUMVA|nr:hypothetical protein EVAR_9836_1 [Eumeta japonica]
MDQAAAQHLISSPLVFNSETRSDAEPQPGPSKRLRTGSSNLENHRGLCLLGIRKNAPLDSTSWVVGKESIFNY